MSGGGGPAASLSAAARRRLLEAARAAIEGWLEGRELPDPREAEPELLEPRGAFVSLKRPGGELRGCVGRADAADPLLSVVVRAAIAAASEDPRFEPVTAVELASLEVQISVLGAMQPVRPEEVVVGSHGLFVTQGDRSGLLLPQIARDNGWDREAFLGWTCRKAGLPRDAWRDPGCVIQAFTATVFGEPERPVQTDERDSRSGRR